MDILDFSVSGLSRGHGFGSVTQVCFGISVSNFMCMSFVAGVGRSLTIFSYVTFKMAALLFWTMFNYNLPIAHCYPLLSCGGILVDHWSTISSSPCSHHLIIMKFSGVITNDKSDVHAKGQGQRSKVKVTEVNTQLNRFPTVTLVWIHIWWWNDAYSLMMLRKGALSFFKVIRQISRSHGSKKRQIWPRLGVSGL